MVLPPPEHIEEFRRAGWNEKRRVDVPAHVPRAHPSYRVLEAFGGLCVGGTGRGVECASSDIQFELLDRTDYLAQIKEWEHILRVSLVGIGRVHHSHGALFLDEAGRWFGLSEIHDAFYLHGESMAAALRNLLRGYRDRPLISSRQQSVDLYGETYSRGDARLYFEAPRCKP